MDHCVTFDVTGRYDPSTNELISEELGVAYPIMLESGVPNLVPQDGRIIHSDGPKRKSHIEDADMHLRHSKTHSTMS